LAVSITIAETQTVLPTGGEGSSRVAFTADPIAPGCPKTLGKRPQQDGEANFDVTNP
jgi:hypothetical protein